MNCCFRKGFEEVQIEALLHKIEIQMKHQSTNFGLALTSVSKRAHTHNSYFSIIRAFINILNSILCFQLDFFILLI